MQGLFSLEKSMRSIGLGRDGRGGVMLIGGGGRGRRRGNSRQSRSSGS